MWTIEEEAYLKENFNKLQYKQLVKKLNRQPGAIHSKARRMGLGHKILFDLPTLKVTETDGHWVTGFTDGEGCFCIIIKVKKNGSAQVTPCFKINLREDDKATLEKIHKIMGVIGHPVKHLNVQNAPSNKGKNTQNQVMFFVSGYKQCQYVVRPFFNKFLLRSKKAQSFKIWCQILDIMTSDTGLCSRLEPEQVLQIDRLRKGMNQNDNQRELIYDKSTKTFSR